MNSDLSMDNLIYQGQVVNLRLRKEEIEMHDEKDAIGIPIDNIRLFEIFPGQKGFNFRIDTADNVYDFQNIHESKLETLRGFVSQNYGMNLSNIELETLGTTCGSLSIVNNTVFFNSNSKTIFSIPQNKIKNITELENTLELKLDGLEIVFNTESNISQHMNTKTTDELCVISGVNCTSPRSKTTMVFFRDHMDLKGNSYDHTIFYSTIRDIIFLPNGKSHYLVLHLLTPLIQGQTTYESVVFTLSNKKIEIVTRGSVLKDLYCGEQDEIILEILEKLSGIKSKETNESIQCTSKTYQGFLYLLPDSLQFLPKSFYIPINTISYVEFLRINLSAAQAKTFDINIIGEKTYNFVGLNKEFFPALESFFSKNNVEIVSEVINDISSGSEENGSDDSDVSGILDDEEY